MSNRTPEQINDDNNIRLRRAEAWIERAQAAQDDAGQFIFYWIAFNALYAWDESSPDFWQPPLSAVVSQFSSDEDDENARHNEGDRDRDYNKIKSFIKKVADEDNDRRLADIVVDNLTAMRAIVQLPYTYKPFWKPVIKDIETMSQWSKHFEEVKDLAEISFQKAAERGKVGHALRVIFSRLYVVRNQIFHGSHSGGLESRGYTQVEKGAELLGLFVPCFCHVISISIAKADDNHPEDWGDVHFRPQSHPDDLECPPPWLTEAE